jgi:cell division protein FtsL
MLNISNFLLLIMVFISALGLLDVRYNHGLAFAQVQIEEQQRDELNEQWRQLRLEHSTLTKHERIEQLAQQKLNMHIPELQHTVIIKLP